MDMLSEIQLFPKKMSVWFFPDFDIKFVNFTYLPVLRMR